MLRGIELDGNKDISIKRDILDMSEQINTLYVPLVNHTNLNCKCLVNVGDVVEKNSIIGMREDIELPILSPSDGTIKEIGECLYMNGDLVPCVVIEVNKKSKTKKEIEDITKYTKDEFIRLLKDNAVVGMGGSDFPTYIKYKASNIETLIVNAVECEPYITSDLMLVKLKAKEILDAISATMIINKIKKCFIAVKSNNTIVIDSFNEHLLSYSNIEIKTVKNMYPMGWERHTVSAVLNKKYDRFPSEIGVVVSNVSTMYAIYKALKYNSSISKRLITFTGSNIKKPINVLVKIGTNIKDIIDEVGIKKGRELKFVVGGPMMGEALLSENVIATKNMNCIMVLKDEDDLEVLPCMRCGRCDQICPAKLSPVLIKDNVDNSDNLRILDPKKCMECGLCTYICPSNIDLRSYVKKAKKEVK